MADFPPSGPTTLTKVVPSYLYQQYNDDEDLQAFIIAQNQMAQEYVNWFVEVLLPIYTSPMVSGALLDWVANGLYGLKRTNLPAGVGSSYGPLNTYQLNTQTLNTYEAQGPSEFYITDDDIFRRILTWHLWKGDGKIFNIRWLKRRIMRFLTGDNGGGGQSAGGDPSTPIMRPPDQTYGISITFGVGNQVNINLQSTRRFATGGAILNTATLNTFALNELDTESVSIPISPYVYIFKAAVEAGVVELPFQYTWVVNIN